MVNHKIAQMCSMYSMSSSFVSRFVVELPLPFHLQNPQGRCSGPLKVPGGRLWAFAPTHFCPHQTAHVLSRTQLCSSLTSSETHVLGPSAPATLASFPFPNAPGSLPPQDLCTCCSLWAMVSPPSGLCTNVPFSTRPSLTTLLKSATIRPDPGTPSSPPIFSPLYLSPSHTILVYSIYCLPP